MAISFSRPDPSSPAAVADANFPTARRGFDQQQVKDFLRMVAAELARSQERERYLEQELRLRRQQPPAPALPATLDDETAARLLGEETTRILHAARESAAAISARATENADRALREANEEARRLREDAELEAARRRKDADTAAEAELEAAKQQGREMVDEARAYRERALGELARRRDLARQQIDQLVHARDRLVQAFERARLAASDVVAEMGQLGEFEEYVNLSPTTGPIPVMVPASQLADASAIGADALARRAAADPDDPALDDSDPGRSAGPGTVDVTAGADHRDDDDDADGDDVAEEVDVSDQVDHADEVEEQVDHDADDAAVGLDATVLQFPGNGAVDSTASAGDDTDDDIARDDTDDGTERSTDRDGGAEIDDEDVTASDVDELFARLRDHGGSAADDAGDHDSDSIDAPDGEPTPFERRDETLTPLIVASARKLKRVLADEQNNALETLRRDAAVTAVGDLVVGEADHVSAYFDAIVDDVTVAITAGAASMSRRVELPDDALASARGAVRDAVGDELVRPLRQRLTERVDTGDGDNEAITRKIRAVYRQVKIKHIDDHLEDVLRIAYNHGALAAVPPDAPVRWIADPEAGACAECEDNTLQGAVPAGSPFPTDHLTPPAHAGCRCLITPADQ